MLPQLTVYAKILYLLMVAISGALCSDYVIMSQCAHNKAIHIAHDGKVSVTDTPTTQNITIAGTPDFLATNIFKVTLFAKETQMYLCFNNHWRLVGMEKLQDSCYFKESIVHGYFEFRSILNLNRRVGFTHRGKPIGPKKNVTDACYHFEKVAASEFSRTHTTSIAATSAAGSSSSSNGHNSSNNNSISATSNSRSRHSSSNLNSAKRESSALTHRNRHRKNRTQIGPRRLHHVQETQEVHTRLRHHQLASSVPEEVSGSKRKKKKKKKALPHGQARQQYLNPKDPAHRRIALELHEQQQQQQPFAEGKPHEHSGDSDMVTNIQDEYSNDDASAVQQDLPNTLDSSTDYLFSSSGSISSTRHMAEQHSKKPLLPGSTNRRRATISNLSSSSTGHRSVDVNLISRSSSKDSQTPRKYYKTLNPSLVVASYQSTVVGDQSSDASNKIAVTGLARSNHNDKNLDDCARRSTSTPRRRSAKCAN